MQIEKLFIFEITNYVCVFDLLKVDPFEPNEFRAFHESLEEQLQVQLRDTIHSGHVNEEIFLRLLHEGILQTTRPMRMQAVESEQALELVDLEVAPFPY